MKTYTIKPLVVGMNETDQGVMTYLRDYGKRIFLPIYVFVVEGGDRTILVDTGLEDFVVPEGAEEATGLKVRYFEEALESVGLSPADVDVILHTHLHNDHCENDLLCENAKVYVQKAELDFFRNPHPIDHRYYPDVLDGMDVVEVEGDKELFDGISAYLTPGHTPGGQSIAINTRAGRALITGFCCNEKNFPPTGPPVASGVHLDVRDAYASVRRVKDLAPDILLPLHDLSVGRRKTIP